MGWRRHACAGDSRAGGTYQKIIGASRRRADLSEVSHPPAFPTLLISAESLVTAAMFGGHIGGEDVVGMPVEVFASTFVAHGRAWIGVTGGDLHIAQA